MKLGEHKPTVIMFGGTTLYFRSGDVDSSLLESDTPKNGKCACYDNTVNLIRLASGVT